MIETLVVNQDLLTFVPVIPSVRPILSADQIEQDLEIALMHVKTYVVDRKPLVSLRVTLLSVSACPTTKETRMMSLRDANYHMIATQIKIVNLTKFAASTLMPSGNVSMSAYLIAAVQMLNALEKTTWLFVGALQVMKATQLIHKLVVYQEVQICVKKIVTVDHSRYARM